MAMSSTATMKMIGIALMIIGLALDFWGYHLTGSVESQITQAFTGSNTDKVMMFYISGAVSFFIGLYLVFKA